MAINATGSLIGGALSGTLGYLEALVGGLFGLYLILVILRWYESRRLVSILKDIRHDLREMGSQKGMAIEERATLIRKIKKKRREKKKK